MRDRKHTLLIHVIYLLIDLACIYLAIYLVMLWRQETLPFTVSWGSVLSSTNPFKVIILLWMPVILFFNQTHGLYQTRREMLESLEIWEVVKSVTLSTLVTMVLVYLLKTQDFPRAVMVFSAVGISVLLSVWRILKKLLVNFLVQRGYNNFNVLIIGAGKVGTLLADEIRKRPALGIKVSGFLDDEKQGHVGQKAWPVLGKLKDFRGVVQREFIHQVFIAIYPEQQMFIKLLEEAKELDVAVRVVPQGYEFMAQDFTRSNIGIIPILEYSDIDVNYRLWAKRVFDFVLSLLLFCVLLPVLMILAVLIEFDGPGPVFYHSRRYGRHGRIFPMYKFRSMVSNADELLDQLKDKNEVDGPIFKIKKDPRVTKVGAFLRKYSLDELPQIMNVIKGDMSLVGPRPLPIDQVERENLRQLKRLDIRPGITGLWQIRGRSDVSFERLVRWDIWYINNWSFGLDFYILFRTLPVVIQGKGAY
ncbi:MAG: sugar transferase [Candidatus Omnitrophica bacterium]|nr:sugar transferase [Candidatus Omnitrophota bacterium]